MYPEIQNINCLDILPVTGNLTVNYSSSDWNAILNAHEILTYISMQDEETVTISSLQWKKTIAEVLIRRKDVWDILAEL